MIWSYCPSHKIIFGLACGFTWLYTLLLSMWLMASWWTKKAVRRCNRSYFSSPHVSAMSFSVYTCSPLGSDEVLRFVSWGNLDFVSNIPEGCSIHA
jgi:hypothetical protein